MAKPTLNKLKLTPQKEKTELTWGDQVIEIKQYLPIEEKLNMVADILNAAADENRFYNPGKIDVYRCLKIIEHYTNLSITDKQKENPTKLFDDFISSGFYTAVFDSIPKAEMEYVYVLIKETADQIYKYNNSAYGILDSLNTDYNNLDLDIQKLIGGIENREGIETVNEIISKLG